MTNAVFPKKLLFSSAIKLLLAGIFIACISKMPYSFYQLSKFIALIGLIVILIIDYGLKNYVGMALAFLGVIFFNPFFRVRFRRIEWESIDKWLAAILILWVIADMLIYYHKRNSSSKSAV